MTKKKTTTNQKEKTMNKNLKKKLEELKIELDAYVLMSQLVFSIRNESGEWQKANKKWKHSPNVVYWNDLEGYGISVDDDGNFNAFNDTDFVCPITLPKFVEVLKELAPKPKAKKQTKQTKPVTYMDVFDRVLDIMDDKTGYAPYADNIEDEENGEVDICLDFDGWQHMTWTNVKAFVGGDENEKSIFEVIADLDMKYEKLASRWDAQFCSSCRILGNVKVEDTSPAGIMKALDEAGL